MTSQHQPEASSDSPALYFLHIPKTAGTSFSTLLRQRFADQPVCPAHLWHQLLAIPDPQRSDYVLYLGHFYAYLGRVVHRPLQVVTFLRDPVERSLSHYAHVMRASDHYFHELAHQLGSFRAFLEDPLTAPLITNFQTRALAEDVDVLSHAATLSDHDLASLKLEQFVETLPVKTSDSALLTTALAALEGCAFVGVTELYDESIRQLNRVFGWADESPSEVLNRAPNRMQGYELDTSTLEVLMERLRLDLLLYEAAKSRFYTNASAALS